MHVRGVENEKADSLSRLSRAGDYAVKDEVFQDALASLGVTITVDLFASRYNKKHPVYCSVALNDSRMLARDAFTISWKGRGLPLIHPPVPLLLRCLKRIREEKITAVVVAPHWLGQPWTNSLRTMTLKTVMMGQSYLALTSGRQMLKNGDKLPPGPIAAYLVDGSMMRESRWF
jgi:hypothetical protein